MNTNVNIGANFGAKWNIEVCKSGKNGIESYYPFGTGLKNNMILDHWLEALTYLFSPSGGNIRFYCDGLLFAAITKGTMHLGKSSIAPTYTQTGLFEPVKSTSYIRPYFNNATGILYPESGMAMFSRTYDFTIETGLVSYSEAGFRPDIANALPTGKTNHLWSRFVFTKETGVSGYLYATSGFDGNITGMYPSGIYINNNQNDLPDMYSQKYSGFSGLEGFDLGWRYNWPQNSGIFLHNESGYTTGFIYSPKNITSLTTGFVSGYISGVNSVITFFPFSNANNPLNLTEYSGFSIQDQSSIDFYFSKNGFNGFNDFIGQYFNTYSGFSYTGFNVGYSTYGSGFVIDSGDPYYSYPNEPNLLQYLSLTGITGKMTGFIGSRNVLRLDGYITGNVGYRSVSNPVTLSTGEFLRLRYDTYMQVPAIINPIPVTGENIVHGEFNGSGSIKLIGKTKAFFGEIDSDGKLVKQYETIGVWWPIHKNIWRDIPSYNRQYTPWANSHLSAVMVASGVYSNVYNVHFNNEFPAINTGIPIPTVWLDDERAYCYSALLGTGKCGNPPVEYREMPYFSTSALSNQTPWPYYYHNTLKVYNYTALNRPTAVWPKSIDIQMIFLGPYPNRDTGFNGFIITQGYENDYCTRTVSDEQGRQFSNTVFTKPSVYENTGAYLNCGIERQYSAWYYKFDNPQMKYEDQIINLFLTFSMGRL